MVRQQKERYKNANSAYFQELFYFLVHKTVASMLNADLIIDAKWSPLFSILK